MSLALAAVGLVVAIPSYILFEDPNDPAPLLLRGVGFTFFPAGILSLALRIWFSEVQKEAIKRELVNIFEEPRRRIGEIAEQTDSIDASIRRIQQFFVLYESAEQLGINRVFHGRYDFTPQQAAIFQEGRQEIFALGITLRTLLAGFATLDTLREQLTDPNTGSQVAARFLIYDPRLGEIRHLRDMADGPGNALKVGQAILRLDTFTQELPENLRPQVRVRLARHIPYFFLLGNERRLFVIPYHFGPGREGSVWEVHQVDDHRQHGLYNFYKSQFDSLWNDYSVELTTDVREEIEQIIRAELHLTGA